MDQSIVNINKHAQSNVDMEGKNNLENSYFYKQQQENSATTTFINNSESPSNNTNSNVITLTHSPGGGSASWSADCSNEHVISSTSTSVSSSTENNKSSFGWSTSFNKMGKSLANVQLPYRVVSIKKRRPKPYFILKLFIDSTENYDLYKKYVCAARLQNDVVDKYKNGEAKTNVTNTTNVTYFDAGFDLFCPDFAVINDSRTGAAVHKLNHKVKCSMMKVDFDADGEKFIQPVGYYMYPRSSTGTKTPLRLANSVGIIDSGYRGHIIAAFDAPPSFSCTGGSYKVEQFQRLVQICPPDLSYPLEVELVADESLLGCGGKRGAGGFGSTGS